MAKVLNIKAIAKLLILLGLISVVVLLAVLWFESSFLSEMAKALIAFGGLFSMIGLFSLAALLSEVSFLSRSKRWPVVSGTVQLSSEEEVTITGDYASATFEKSAIFYRYEVDGKQYIVREQHLDKTKRQLKQILAQYPIGMKVNVFYNPRKPRESTLKTNYNKIPIDLYLKTTVPLALGALFFGLAFTLA
jgi:hypothetical protein